jgi:SAM-dependent methyltransferase
MNRATAQYIGSLNLSSMDVLEISGEAWRQMPFRSYSSASFPDYDICESPLVVAGFDIVIAEQVLEHVLWPYRAVKNVYQMLRPGGIFFVTTPFLLRVHLHPVDCCRWTETGMKHLLAEGGFKIVDIETGSWGNRACVRANFSSWAPWTPLLNSLANEPEFPVVVWAFARKPSSDID